ncbi:uncharacterized protein LOC127565664 isoform X2 [Drosophila albomicans]|uniref:Uncharacterized protein LOC127565664 isoform X2 n=1 Tax=Drosophila albomicans TaxID=7291 RepID=A0A9C6WFK5_DROAB|nr:uncharacterized protein LOC127565664 isoform X2 [Drosophila albomicans]
MMTTLQRCRRSNCDRARVVADDAAAGSGPCGWLAAAGDGCLTGNRERKDKKTRSATMKIQIDDDERMKNNTMNTSA